MPAPRTSADPPPRPSVPLRTIELTDPRALRAVAHPLRLRLLGLLRRDGPMTATRAGVATGESAASCSFHLRQLAKYGLVEEAGGGRGRERPWRATSQFTSWPRAPRAPELAAAATALGQVVAERYLEWLLAWLERRPEERTEWQEAAALGDALVYLTAPELTELRDALFALAEPFHARTSDPALRPEGARAVAFIQLAFPVVDD